MDVLLRKSENLQDPARSKFATNSMYVAYSSTTSSCSSSNMFPSYCGDCLPSNKQQSFLSDVFSTSSALPFVIQEGLLDFRVCLSSKEKHDFSAEYAILQYESQRNLNAQSNMKSPAQITVAETTKNLDCKVDYVPEQYSWGKEVSPPPGFESLASVLTSTAGLPSTSVAPLLNSADATAVSVASPRSFVAPSWSSVIPQLLSKPISPNHLREFGSMLLTKANQESRTRSLLLTAANEETRTGSSLLTTANQEEGGALSLLTMANQEIERELSLLTMANQEIGTMSSKANCKAAKSELYKTELCRAFSENGSCGYGDKCQFAHGELDQRAILRHAKYKTKQCWTYHSTGFCYYGARCNFIHDENRLDRNVKLTSGQGENSEPGFARKLDPASGIRSDSSLRTDVSPVSQVNLVNPSFDANLDTTWTVRGDPRLGVNSDPHLELKSDLVVFGLNPRVERASNAGVGPSLKSMTAPSLKPGISINSQPKSGQTVKSSTLQNSNGMVPISNRMVPISYGMVPISSGMVRSSPPIASTLDARFAPSPDQTSRQGNQCNILGWNFGNQSFGQSPAFTDFKPPEPFVSISRDTNITFKHSPLEFSGDARENRFAHGQPHISPPQLPPVQSQVISASVLHPGGGHSWNKQHGVLGLSSNQSCTEGLSSSYSLMASTSNVWSSLIKHPRCWTLS